MQNGEDMFRVGSRYIGYRATVQGEIVHVQHMWSVYSTCTEWRVDIEDGDRIYVGE